MKSHYLELYPPHKCENCPAVHYTFPDIHDDIQKFIPFEIIGIIEGTIPKEMIGEKSPATITGLHWGVPGSKEIKFQQLIFHN